ncbi:MAG: hypothetical protein L0Y66_26570 [Myxococcaceae bacterium]|nr:hypothetical protein [Myxococcaceae bacterium]
MGSELSAAGFLEQVQADWAARRLDAYLSHFAENADILNRTGAWFRGRAAFRPQLEWLFTRGVEGRPELFSPTTRVESARELGPGLWVLVQHREEGPRQSRATWVLSHSAGRWLVETVTVAPLGPERRRRPRIPRAPTGAFPPGAE